MFVAGSISTYIRQGQKRDIVERQIENEELTVKSLRQMARESIMMDDDTSLVNHINLLKQFPNTAYAMVLYENGRVRAHTEPLEIGKVLNDPVSIKALAYRAREKPLTTDLVVNGRPVLDLSLPVIVRQNPDEYRGVARIGFDKQKIDDDIAKSLDAVDRQIIRAFIITLIIGILGAVLLAGFITRPIKIVMDGARQIGEGKLNHRISVSTQDEIRDLADEFNLMARKLGELDQMKQDFVSNVTHELRSPMTSIRGYIDLLIKEAAGPLQPLQKDYLTIIKNSAVRLGRFIDNLLDVAKIEAQKLKLSPESQDMHDLAHEMVVLFKPQADEKKLHIINAVPEKLPLAFVDKDKTAEVLINLTSNAIKFTPEDGEVTIRGSEGPNYLEIGVEDTGVGIPPEMIGKLFNKFEQVKTTKGLARNQKGTGLGLTIAKGIIEAHGGKIWIESPASNGKGTVFKFTIPKYNEAEHEFKV